jgi:ubiquinone/menaquinone biosynthesis C-methylase UbiE
MKNKSKIREELSSFYTGKEAFSYDKSRTSTPAARKEIGLQQKNISFLIRKSKGKKLLDVACGTGFFFNLYKGKKIYGVDISEDMLKIAKSRNLGNIMLLKKADVKKIPFSDSFFDIVISNKFIMHYPDYMKVLKEMARVAKKGGSIIADFPNKNSLTYFFTKSRIKSGKIRYYNFFTLKEIKKIADSLNLEIKDIIGTTVLSYRFLPKFLYWKINLLNKIPFLKRFSYVHYVRLVKK